jgi:hypothetical protein
MSIDDGNIEGKGKVVPVIQLSTTLWRCIGGAEVQLHAFLTSALQGDECSASRPGSFISM